VKYIYSYFELTLIRKKEQHNPTKKLKINGENAKPFAHSKDYLYFWQKYSD